MRVDNPHPFGHRPDDASLAAAIASANRIELFDTQERVRATLPPEEMGELATLMRVRRNGPIFDQQLQRPFALILHREGGDPQRVTLSHDGSLYFPAWNGWTELEDPERFFSWLAERGLPEILEWWRAQHGDAAVAARARWREALPRRLRARWNPAHEEMVDASFDAASLLDALGGFLRSRRGVIEDLMEWYAAGTGPLDGRPGYESLPRLLLARLGFDPIVATIPRLSSRALSGCARWLLEGPPIAPALEAPVVALDATVREALVEAARGFSNEDAERLRDRLFPRGFATPPSTRLLGTSSTVALRRVVSAAEGVYAIDGAKLILLRSGERRELTTHLSTEPIGAIASDVLIRVGSRVRRLDPDGKLVAELPAATPAQRARARTRIVAETASSAPGSTPIAPDDDSRAAFEAYGHLGFELPLTRAWLGDDGRTVALDGTSPHRVNLPGRALHAVATREGLLLCVERGGRTVVTWLDASGTLESADLELPPGDVRRLLGDEARALLVVDTGRSHAVLEVPRSPCEARPDVGSHGALDGAPR